MLLDEIYDSITHKIKEKKKAPNFERVTNILGERFDRTTPLKQIMEVQRLLIFKAAPSILQYNRSYGYFNIGISSFG